MVCIGVHGQVVPEHLEALWSQKIAITARLIDRVSTPMLLKRVVAAIVEPLSPPLRRFKFQHMLEAYDTVRRAAGTGAPRVIIET